MKKLVFLICIIAIEHTFAQSPDPSFNDKMALSEARNHEKAASFTESDDYADFDLTYQRLNFTVDPTIRQIAGSVFSNIRFLKDNISQVQFDLVQSMVVDSVNFNQDKATFVHSGNKISITLPLILQAGNLGSVEVFYHGVPPDTGFGSFTINTHNNVPILWTLSEPYGARDWWPCKQSLADKIDSIDVFITCPSQYKAAGNGKLMSDLITGSTRTAHWKHLFPIATYLVGIAVTNYETYSDFLDIADGKKIEVLNYVYPEYLSTAKLKTEEILSILSFYNSKFINYPFASEKYGHAQFGWGGGMEHQTMSFMTTLDFELVAHEMAHQWFGDYITLSSWHNIWMNEGFATYLVGLVYENLKDGYFWPIWKNIQVQNITSVPDGSVYVADTTNVNRIFNGRLTYTKGGYLLHMLRWEMGDKHFFQGMKDYLTDPTIAKGFASQEKFVKHMEAAADTSFTEFFNDWYYGQGYPTYHMNYFPDPISPNRQMLRISQSSSDASVSFFEMHVPVRVWKDGVSTDLRLYNTQQDQEFVIPIAIGKVDSVQFDPQEWLCARADRITVVPKLNNPAFIQIIPDYSGEKIHVILPAYSENGTLRMMDMNGIIVSNILLNGTESWLDIRNLHNGIYLVEVRSKNQTKTDKIVINK